MYSCKFVIWQCFGCCQSYTIVLCWLFEFLHSISSYLAHTAYWQAVRDLWAIMTTSTNIIVILTNWWPILMETLHKLLSGARSRPSIMFFSQKVTKIFTFSWQARERLFSTHYSLLTTYWSCTYHNRNQGILYMHEQAERTNTKCKSWPQTNELSKAANALWTKGEEGSPGSSQTGSRPCSYKTSTHILPNVSIAWFTTILVSATQTY